MAKRYGGDVPGMSVTLKRFTEISSVRIDSSAASPGSIPAASTNTTCEISWLQARFFVSATAERYVHPRGKQRRLERRDALRAVGMQGAPTEYERFFGY
jgi:hypothetical protein